MLKDLCFEIIQTCPNRCKFCSSNSSIEKDKIISFDKFKETIEYFIKNGGIEEISISGGEPFLHPDLYKMVKYCKNKGIRTVIFTSGIKRVPDISEEEKELIKEECQSSIQEIEKHEPWNERLKNNIKRYYNRLLESRPFGSITREEFRKLKELGLDKIVFDYQAYEQETDNELMGRKNLSTYLGSSMIRARLENLDVDVHFIPMKPNYKQFLDLLECLEIANVQKVSILNFVPQGRGMENKDELMLDKEEMREFSEILKIAKDNYSGKIRIGIPLLGNIKHLCTAGTEKLDIKYDGTVLPCPAFKEISQETMQKYGIRLYNIYEDLEKIVVREGKRKEPLCKQIYKFNADLSEER